jgi:NAD(P)-dependent dehydrogenase (short-subunit alcohol dehydrogenase family)
LVLRTKERLEGVAEEINATGGRAIALVSDLTDLGTHDELITRTVGEFGGLDTVASCAGGGDMWRPLLFFGDMGESTALTALTLPKDRNDFRLTPFRDGMPASSRHSPPPHAWSPGRFALWTRRTNRRDKASKGGATLKGQE